MPKIAKNKKSVKQKLSAEERSQVAKDRWAKRRGSFNDFIAKNKVEQESPVVEAGSPPPVSPDQPVIPQNPTPEQPPVTPESEIPVPDEVAMLGLAAQGLMEKDTKLVESMQAATPVAQLTPVRAPKQKRYTGPKEFSVALKAAEGRLAKAIVERAEAAGKMAMLQAEIPSLVQIISALKGQQNIPAAPYDLSGMVPSAYQAPMTQQYAAPHNPLAAIQAAQPTAPVSRAQGGTMQFGPEVLGEMEGPDDDNPDRFLEGPHAGGGWIGG